MTRATSHGTAEFYKARAAIPRRMIERHRFNIVAVIGPTPLASTDTCAIKRTNHHPKRPFSRFPTWMWRNTEVRDFVEWLRGRNEHLPAEDRTEFRGLDIYSLGSSIAAVLAYLDRIDPEEAKAARKRYGCLTPWQDDPTGYGRTALHLGESPCEEGVVAELRRLLDRRLLYVRRDGDSFFDATQIL